MASLMSAQADAKSGMCRLCSLSGVPFEVDAEGALRAEGVPAQQLDAAKKHGAPLMLAIAGGQAAAQAYRAVRNSLPKVQYNQHVSCMSIVPTRD